MVSVEDSPMQDRKRARTDGSSTTTSAPGGPLPFNLHDAVDTDLVIHRLPGMNMCAANAIVTMARLAKHPCGELLDAAYDTRSGPFRVDTLAGMSDDVHVGAAIFSRGYESDTGDSRDLRRVLQRGGAYLLAVDSGDEAHGIGIFVDAGTVFTIDSRFKRVRLTTIMGVVRSVSAAQAATLLPVVFGDAPAGFQHVSGSHGAMELGADEVFTTPLTTCVICPAEKVHGLTQNTLAKSMRYDFDGAKQVWTQQMQCTNRRCRTTYGPNYLVLNHSKMQNTASMATLGNTLFVSAKRAFSVKMLMFFISLNFRGQCSAKAFAWSYSDTFCRAEEGETEAGWAGNFHKLMADAAFYLMVLKAFSPIDRHLNIVIGDELTAKDLDAYDRYVHEQIFRPKDFESVTALVGDGHKKVHCPCHPVPGDLADDAEDGIPRQGWFMLVDPRNQRVLAVTAMDRPEGNAVVRKSLSKVLHLYPKVNLYVMDRVCGFAPSATNDPALAQLRYYSVDWLHGKTHSEECAYNPWYSQRLARRLGNLNTSVCEQVFSWFRGYAKMMNKMRPLRHRFMALQHCIRHNALLEAGDRSHLNEYVQAAESGSSSGGHYACAKRPAAKTDPIPKAMERVTKRPAMMAAKRPAGMGA